jgi:hypothetical protein
VYLCWGVRYSVLKGNRVHHNGFSLFRNGISLGHKDTDNLIEKNHIYENAKHGLNFRQKTEPNGAHRNVVKNNLIENNGMPRGRIPWPYGNLPADKRQSCGIYINGITHDLVIENNTIRETRAGAERRQINGIYIGKGVGRVKKLKSNKITGHPGKTIVNRSGNAPQWRQKN